MAYSVFGQVMSLNGEPEKGMTVVAAGAENCSHFSEESTLETSGAFRIRGLQPYCSYDIQVETNPDMGMLVERVTPSSIRVSVSFLLIIG